MSVTIPAKVATAEDIALAADILERARETKATTSAALDRARHDHEQATTAEEHASDKLLALVNTVIRADSHERLAK